MARKRRIRQPILIKKGRIVKSRKTVERPSLCEKHFWILAVFVVFISVCIRTFDFSLVPLSYKGLFITRPYYGLHSWANANVAWAGRSHVKYGLDYTKGYCTLVVGNPPPEHPQRYVSHPPLNSLITAFGMLIFGTKEWQIRLFELILSIPALFMILYFLRELYSGSFAIVSGLLLVVLPIFAYFPFHLLLTLMMLLVLHRYLILTGRLKESIPPKTRH